MIFFKGGRGPPPVPLPNPKKKPRPIEMHDKMLTIYFGDADVIQRVYIIQGMFGVADCSYIIMILKNRNA